MSESERLVAMLSDAATAELASGPTFVHLRCHTEYSVVDGSCRIDELLSAATQDAQGAFAITDLANMFGALKFYKAARNAGIKPILGCDVAVQGQGRVLFLVQNHQGYLNLCELLSRAWQQPNLTGATDVCLQWAWVAELNEGLLVLSGARYGAIGAALLTDPATATTLAQQWQQHFPGRFYLEIQRAGHKDDEAIVHGSVSLAAQLALPVVATHPIQFMTPADYEAHEVRVCIAEGELLGNPARARRFTTQQHFCSQADMVQRFADLGGALANSGHIAQRCNLELVLGQAQLPVFPTPLQDDGAPMPIAEYFRIQAQQGLERRLAQRFGDVALRAKNAPHYQERLHFEIATILHMGFPGYFLIVADFIGWARTHGCPVGPGRGSGAGSLVAWALGITDLDPLQYQLLFERFLNPQRVSMPDFDIDFCQSNRDRVIEYVKDKYGVAAVSQIATFGTMAAKAVVRDVGRVMELGYGFCDGISKLIPGKPIIANKAVTLADAIAHEEPLARRMVQEEEVANLLGMAQKLEGLTRNIGTHAGGVLIAPSRLTDFCPLYCQPGNHTVAVSQYDKDDVEAIGLVKFDFLGLATLTILERARQMIVARDPQRQGLDYALLPLDDAKVYRLFAQGLTEAVFQFESPGMQRMLRQAQPTRIEDLIAMNALYRPGPMDNIPDYIAYKLGHKQVVYPHPLLEGILSETYGIMVYQEQVMQTAQILGGYSLGAADLLRRAMGKKKAEEMAEHRAIFRDGAAQKGISANQADIIFDQMETFAGYGFNKSHAAAYSLLAYHTAWVKCYYPAEFYAANMTIEMSNTDKLKVLIDDAVLNFGLRFDPPDINRGGVDFESISDTQIRYSLAAVKGAGESAVQAIVAARGEAPFLSFFDFCRRIDKTSVNKRTVEALIKAGAFDTLHANRAALVASIGLGFDYAQLQAAHQQQGGLFDDGHSHAKSSFEPDLVDAVPWSLRERLQHESEKLGFHLSGHLFEEHAREVRQFAPKKLADVTDSKDMQILAGIVTGYRKSHARNGGVLHIFHLDDGSNRIEMSLDESGLDGMSLQEQDLLVVQVVVQNDRFTGNLRGRIYKVYDLARARSHFGRYLLLEVPLAQPLRLADIAAGLQNYPQQQPANTGDDSKRPAVGLRIRVQIHTPAASAQWELGPEQRFYPSEAAMQYWSSLCAHARILYQEG